VPKVAERVHVEVVSRDIVFTHFISLSLLLGMGRFLHVVRE
jgi:hypothetical protein